MPEECSVLGPACVWLSTCQFGEDDLLHNSRQQADISISSLQSAVLLEAIKQQRLKPEHVLKICTLPLDKEWKEKMDFRGQPSNFKTVTVKTPKNQSHILPQEGSMLWSAGGLMGQTVWADRGLCKLLCSSRRSLSSTLQNGIWCSRENESPPPHPQILSYSPWWYDLGQTKGFS